MACGVSADAFDLPTPLPIRFGLGLTFDVNFAQDGEITFHTIRADFNV